MRGKWLVAVLAALLPEAATALSCAEYSISDTYWYHQERPETFVLAQGAFLDLELIEAMKSDYTKDPVQNGRTVYSARFEGFLASAKGFDKAFSAPVTLIFPDFSLIGGGYDTAAIADNLPGTTGLVWLMETDGFYQATAGLCDVFIDTDPASVKPALDCLSGRRCPKS